MSSFDQNYGLRRDAFAPPGEAELFRGGGLDAHGGGIESKVRGDIADHPRHVRCHARRLRDDSGIDIDDAKSLRADFFSNIP